MSERELEKFSKYRDMAADLASQNPGWRVKTVPLVVGTLDLVNSFRRVLSELTFFSEREILKKMRESQFEALVSATRIIWQHLAI